MTTIAVVGLGYVGLPLAVAFGKKYPTIGFDLSAAKIASYVIHVDPTGEVTPEELKAATQASCPPMAVSVLAPTVMVPAKPPASTTSPDGRGAMA